MLYGKGQQRLYFLKRLRSFHVDQELLCLFYNSVVQSVTINCLICWWSSLSIKSQNKLEHVRKVASKIIGSNLPTLHSVFQSKAMAKMRTIVNENHVLSDNVSWLNSGKRLKSCLCRITRYMNSSIPNAVRLFNSSVKSYAN